MSRIRSRDTKPELILKKPLEDLGFIYHRDRMYGKPDYVHLKERIVVFMQGCFWHACPIHYREPKTSILFWRKKVKRNQERDKEVDKYYEDRGWLVLRIWEHDVKDEKRLDHFLRFVEAVTLKYPLFT